MGPFKNGIVNRSGQPCSTTLFQLFTVMSSLILKKAARSFRQKNKWHISFLYYNRNAFSWQDWKKESGLITRYVPNYFLRSRQALIRKSKRRSSVQPAWM